MSPRIKRSVVRFMIVLAVLTALVAPEALLWSPRIVDAASLTTLHSFDGGDGASPWAGLVQGNDGNFYGTTVYNAPPTLFLDFGTVFKITPGGTLTTLHIFSGSDGANPYSGLVQGSDGSFYGTTYGGGASGNGTVFKITSSGTFTTLYSFSGSDGSGPFTGRLVQGSDGNFYGTTSFGGGPPGGAGTVFKITPSGLLTTLYTFSGSDDGAYPYVGVAQGSDGNFYGTTYRGGTLDSGTVFQITSSGTLTTLHSFSGSDGANPVAEPVQGSDGNLYGVTSQGGAGGVGTVFRITPSGTLTTLYSFGGSDGAMPQAALLQGNDGTFYGTTNGGGIGDFGTVFQITPSGTLTTLHSFSDSDGANPVGWLVQAGDGSFYGTTNSGGAGGWGTVFKIAFVPTNKGQCKNGGWQTFGIFKNQGDCVSFVENGK